jgi:mycothiol synthase
MSNSILTPPSGGDLVCRRARLHEIPSAMAIILGSLARPAPTAQVVEFINSATARRIDIQAIWVAEKLGRIVWAVLPILNPGRTLLLLTSHDVPQANLAQPNFPAARLVGEICRHFGSNGVHLAQVLLESQARQAREFFSSMGFNEIAELIYLQGAVPKNSVAPILPEHMRLVEYSPATHALFAETIIQTYHDSLDCPVLSGMRDIGDVIAGHQATGEFNPAGWQVLLKGDEPMGVFLLSRIPQSDAVELVYLGLCPQARQKGLGNLLMRQIFFLILHDHGRRLSLAVDAKNAPALKLYFGFGMRQVATRWAMIRDLRATGHSSF